MQCLSLNGQWQYQRDNGPEAGSATVPGDIYRDLLDNGQIPDPFYRDNEERLQWIGESNWTFTRTFEVPCELLNRDVARLCCDGLDTLATIWINGKVIGETDNMFRRWQWDILDHLQAGENTIKITFASAVKYCESQARLRGMGDLLYPNKIYAAIPGMMRKQQCNFGWDWGIKAVTCGIWRDISIQTFNTARLADSSITQHHQPSGQVDVSIRASIERRVPAPLGLRVSLLDDGDVVAIGDASFQEDDAELVLTVTEPKLWWPNNLGDQPRYDVIIELIDQQNTILDTHHQRIGLRTLRLDRHPDESGESFQFVINGIPFFAKGANWIPADAIQSRMTPARYRRLVEDAAAANMNMLRVWGGGIYEDDAFYKACDERGICIWQDFMFGGGTSELDIPAFRENVLAEAGDQIRRLRHHACMALWCGNNEMEMDEKLHHESDDPRAVSRQAYTAMFDESLPKLVGALHSDCDYWPSSPHTPHGERKNFNDPTCGDAHLWDVWHEGMPFEWYRSCEHRFNSEFGFQSLPEPKTIEDFTDQEDRNITSFVMEQHQRSHGNPRIIQYMLAWFRAPNSFENTLWLSQILQGMSIKYACEHWRRSMPRGMGTLYWQLNDCWPVASWSSIDDHGRWKALHYMARHFFAPLLISGIENVAESWVEIHVTSDLLEAVTGTVRWFVTDIEGHRLSHGEQGITALARTSQHVQTLNVADWIEAHEKSGLLVWLELEADGQPTSRNLVFFARPVRRPRIFSPRPKHLQLCRDPKIEVCVEPVSQGVFEVTLTSAHPALWVWLELEQTDARFSDNFLHLRPGASTTIQVRPETAMTHQALNEQLIVRSLVDTY